MKPQFLESIFDSGTAIRLSEISVIISDEREVSVVNSEIKAFQT